MFSSQRLSEMNYTIGELLTFNDVYYRFAIVLSRIDTSVTKGWKNEKNVYALFMDDGQIECLDMSCCDEELK